MIASGMHASILAAIADGATVVTASNRLSRDITRNFTERQREQGRTAWTTPAILPLDAYVKRCFREWLQSRHARSAPTLLNSIQEAAIWERIIREWPEGGSLLKLSETAQAASGAWALIHEYNLKVGRGDFQGSEDCAAFWEWSREFTARCQENRWMEEARLSEFVRGAFERGEIRPPSRLLLAGFDEFTPRQSLFLDSIACPQETVAPAVCNARAERYKLRNSEEELTSAALWARDLLQRGGANSIGIVVPGIAADRKRVERIFSGTMPAAAFHISLGTPLAQHPAVHAALLLLDLACGSLQTNRAGVLLRSPFLAGFSHEAAARAHLDAKLRRDGAWAAGIEDILNLAARCPVLSRKLAALKREAKDLSKPQLPGQWSHAFAKMLDAVGWPGDRTLTSAEYQTAEAWKRLLSSLAGLDITAERVDARTALSRLRRLAAGEQFQEENVGAPVEIMGVLEASGVSFDHLWVMGMHDEEFPKPSHPNPFLPLPEQRENKLPHSSPERELDFANLTLRRLGGSAPEVVFSYPSQDGERTLNPTPLLQPLDAWVEVACPPGPLTKEESFEHLIDDTGPPVAAATAQRGGAGLLKDMSDCAFRAFAKRRLDANQMEDPGAGLSPRDKGSIVHKAMEILWRELKSHEALLALTPLERLDAIQAAVRQALVENGGSKAGFHPLEEQRLTALLQGWLDIETAREPFTVLAQEQEREVSLGGLLLKVRMDRIDELADGRRVLIDYKTGEIKTKAWEGDRPAEPQLPLYCISEEHSPAAVVFAQIRTGSLKFHGVKEVALEPFKKLGKGDWRQVLTALAQRFADGDAQVDPRSADTCRLCHLTALCRVRDLPPEDSEGVSDDAA